MGGSSGSSSGKGVGLHKSVSSKVSGSSNTEELSHADDSIRSVASQVFSEYPKNESSGKFLRRQRSYSCPDLTYYSRESYDLNPSCNDTIYDNRSLDYGVDPSAVGSALPNPEYETLSSTEPASLEFKVGVPSSQSQSSSVPAHEPAPGKTLYAPNGVGKLGPGAMLANLELRPEVVERFQRALILHAIGQNPQFAALAKKIIDGAPQEQDKLGLLKRCLSYEITGEEGTLTLSTEGSLNSGAVESLTAKFVAEERELVQQTGYPELDQILMGQDLEPAYLRSPLILLRGLLGESGVQQNEVEQEEQVGSSTNKTSEISLQNNNIFLKRVSSESDTAVSSAISEIDFNNTSEHNPFEPRDYRSRVIQIGKYAEDPKEDFAIELGGKTLTTKAFSPAGRHAGSLAVVIKAAFDKKVVPEDRQQDIASWAFYGTPRVVDGEWTEGYFEFMFSKGKSIKVHLRDLADMEEIKGLVDGLAAESANASVSRWARDTGTRVNELKDKEPGSAMSFLIWSCLLRDQRFVRTHDYDKKFTLKDLENPKALLDRLAEIHRPRQAAEAKKPSPPAPASNPQPPANGPNIQLSHVPGAQNNVPPAPGSSSSNSSSSSTASSATSSAGSSSHQPTSQ